MYVDSDEEIQQKSMTKQPRNKLQRFIENVTVVDIEKKEHTFFLSEFHKSRKGFTMQYYKVEDDIMSNPVLIETKEFQVKF